MSAGNHGLFYGFVNGKYLICHNISNGLHNGFIGLILRINGAVSAPGLFYDFPGTVIISVNDEVVHGIPGERTIEPGDVVTFEPIICTGSGKVYEDRDGWTMRTEDGSIAAHFEHTLVITRRVPLLLTAA